jgi:hypothetical protein
LHVWGSTARPNEKMDVLHQPPLTRTSCARLHVAL